MTPRGIRNNNPGNIRLGDPWRGLTKDLNGQGDEDFCQFVAPVYGIRALVKILRSYNKRDSTPTVKEIINRWAPPVENNTSAYALSVSEDLGVKPNDLLKMQDQGTLMALVKAIIRHENGRQPYSDNTIADAIRLASV